MLYNNDLLKLNARHAENSNTIIPIYAQGAVGHMDMNVFSCLLNWGPPSPI